MGILVTVADGYNGQRTELSLYIKGDNIWLTDGGSINYPLGEKVDRKEDGLRAIIKPMMLNSSVLGWRKA